MSKQKMTATKTFTLRIDETSYRSLKECAQSSNVSINSFVVAALEDHLTTLRRAEIDAAFAEMASDVDYQKEAMLLAENCAVWLAEEEKQ